MATGQPFQNLADGDILFIDSSHVLRTGSDVQHEFLEVLPRRAPGVYVHVHDLFFPREYPRHWIAKRRLFGNEQYLLQSFLAFNSEFSTILALAYLRPGAPGRAPALVCHLRPTFGDADVSCCPCKPMHGFERGPRRVQSATIAPSGRREKSFERQLGDTGP